MTDDELVEKMIEAYWDLPTGGTMEDALAIATPEIERRLAVEAYQAWLKSDGDADFVWWWLASKRGISLEDE